MGQFFEYSIFYFLTSLIHSYVTLPCIHLLFSCIFHFMHLLRINLTNINFSTILPIHTFLFPSIPLICVFTHPPIQPFIHSFIHSHIHPSTHLPKHELVKRQFWIVSCCCCRYCVVVKTSVDCSCSNPPLPL